MAVSQKNLKSWRAWMVMTAAMGLFFLIPTEIVSAGSNETAVSGIEADSAPWPLKRSDVLFSPRFYGNDWFNGKDWKANFDAFGANKIVWTYAGEQYLQEAQVVSQGIPVQCTFPSRVPDNNTLPPATVDEMACIGLDGGKFSHAGSGWPLPDVNSTLWRDYQMVVSKNLIDKGCRSFQQDEPAYNWYSATVFGGCYGTESMAGFRSYLKNNLSASELTALGIVDIDNFNYRDNNLLSLKQYFYDFQKQATKDYFVWLHSALRQYANAPLIFSSNILHQDMPKWDWLFGNFDFLMSEVYESRTSMLSNLRLTALRMGASFKNVNAITIANNDVWLNQRAIASAYSLGITVIAPWDVYLRDAPRFYGSPTDFQNLFAMIRSNPSFFDTYTLLAESDGAILLAESDGAMGTIKTLSTIGSALDGTVMRVDRTTYPDRTLIVWTRQTDAKFKTIRKGTTVKIGGVLYNTIVDTTVGNIYLPKDVPVSVDASVWVDDGSSDGTVTKVETIETTKPQRVAVSWTGQTTFKSFQKRDRVKIGNTVYAIVAGTTGGTIYLAAGSEIPVGAPITVLMDTPSSFAHGAVTKIESSSTGAVLSWTEQNNRLFKTIKGGTKVEVGGVVYTTITDTTSGKIFLPNDVPVPVVGASVRVEGVNIPVVEPVRTSGDGAYYIVVSQHTSDARKRGVHVVDWDEIPAHTTLHLKKTDFPVPPTMLVTLANPQGVPISYTSQGDYYVYLLGNLDTWAFIY